MVLYKNMPYDIQSKSDFNPTLCFKMLFYKSLKVTSNQNTFQINNTYIMIILKKGKVFPSKVFIIYFGFFLAFPALNAGKIAHSV